MELAGRKSSVSLAKQDPHEIVVHVGDGQIEFAIVVQVRDRNKVRKLPQHKAVCSRSEGSITIAKKDAERVICIAGHGQVGNAVTFEISEGKLHRCGSCGRTRTGDIEASVTPSKEDGYSAIVAVEHGHILLAITVEVGHKDRTEVVDKKRRPRSLRVGSVSLTQIDRDRC